MQQNRIRSTIARSWPGRWLASHRFRGSDKYWEARYAAGGTSGAGSYGAAAQWKAASVNKWVRDHGITSIIDLGCGDGNQLKLAEYPRYLGLDRSATVISKCIREFAHDPTKSFISYDPASTSDPAGWLRADAALSLEVIFHLVEDAVREEYLQRLFASAERYVIICSSDRSGISQGPHERHEPFTPWVETNAADWRLVERLTPPAQANLVSELFLFERTA